MTVSNDAGSLDLVDFFGFSLSSFLFFDLHKGFKSKESGTQALSEIFSHISPASKCCLGCCVEAFFLSSDFSIMPCLAQWHNAQSQA